MFKRWGEGWAVARCAFPHILLGCILWLGNNHDDVFQDLTASKYKAAWKEILKDALKIEASVKLQVITLVHEHDKQVQGLNLTKI